MPDAQPPINPAPATNETDPIKMGPPTLHRGQSIPASSGKSYVIGRDGLSITSGKTRRLRVVYRKGPTEGLDGVDQRGHAAGLTRSSCRLKSSEAQGCGFLRNPTVTVNVTGFNSKKYSLWGKWATRHLSLVVPTTVNAGPLVNAVASRTSRIRADSDSAGRKTFSSIQTGNCRKRQEYQLLLERVTRSSSNDEEYYSETF